MTIETYPSHTGGGPYHMPPSIFFGLQTYLKHGQCGDFLLAVLSNDLMGAVGRADQDSAACLAEICRYVHWEMPGGCHGSRDAVAAWSAAKAAAQRLQPDET